MSKMLEMIRREDWGNLNALNHQQTISINKLKKLMQSMNMSLEPSESKEVRYLKREIKNLHRHIRRMRNKNQMSDDE